ncbi:histidinol-phosphatase [Micrococcales bacterium 31B]|nr:histidinol-phosphatase [Micrococcales bacterium 31B]
MSADTSYEQDVRLAHVLADAVDKITMERFRALDLSVSAKTDKTIVSDADQAAENHIRQQLKRARSRDAILGEEFGASEHMGAQRTWVVDPIDGTSNFVRGVPVWATLIGLLDNGEPVAGLVSAPAIGRRWWAAKGMGAWTGRNLTSAQRLNVSTVSRLEDASFSYSALEGWSDVGKLDDFLAMTSTLWRTRAFGDFWSYMMVAEGAVDFAAEPELALHDMAALVPIVVEAGGRFTSLAGRDGCHGGNALASNGLLHDAALKHLSFTPESAAAFRAAGGTVRGAANNAPASMLASDSDADPAAAPPTAPLPENRHGHGMVEADYVTQPIALPHTGAGSTGGSQ